MQIRSLAACIGIVLGVASMAAAQPADRGAAFTSAIAAAQGDAPSQHFYEAKIENKDGQWIIEVEMTSGNAAQITEFEFDASSIALHESSSKTPSPSKQTQLLGILGLLPGAGVTPAGAIAAIVPRTPEGTQLSKIEREVENGALFYRFHFLGSSGETRLFVNATTGVPSTGTGGGNPPGGGTITMSQAVAIALTARPGTVREVEFESDDNSWKVKILTAAGLLYEVEVSAATGAIIKNELKNRSREDKAEDRLVHIGMGLANVTDEQILALVAAAAPVATPVKIEHEFEQGRLIVKVTVQDAAGLRVLRFDAWNSGQTVGAPVIPAVPAAPVPVVTPIAAINAALAAVPGSFAIEVELEIEGGRSFYRVRTLTAGPLRLRETIVDAKTGIARGTALLPMGISYLLDASRVNARKGQLSVTFAQAIQSVLAQIPDGTIVKIELEPEGSGLVYNVDSRVGDKAFEMQVNGQSGFTSPR